MNYDEFLLQKKRSFVDAGFHVELDELNPLLFPFQKFCVQTALRKGKFAFFQDCGLGKTFQQLEWAHQIVKHTGKDVIILAPLAVVDQTYQEAKHFGIDTTHICIINYDQLHNVDVSKFIGVVLDESSIIKNFDGATRKLIIELFADTPYKLACTATPSPNDPMELGNHSEFLNVMPYNEMLAMYFVHDGGDTAKWRLKGHAKERFYEWVSEWGVMLSDPADIGFKMDGYHLPSLNLIEHKIKTESRDNGQLFNDVAVSATNFNSELRLSQEKRLDAVLDIINNIGEEDILIWVKQNEESKMLKKLIPKAIEITGSDSNEYKKSRILWFTSNKCICQLQNQKESITENGISKINQGFQNTETQQKTKETKEEESVIIPSQNLEKSHLRKQKTLTKKIQKQSSKEILENHTEYLLKNTMDLLQNRETNAQYVEEKVVSSQKNKDCTSIIATQQKKSEGFCASTVTKPLENFKTKSNYLKGQYCTCVANKKGKILISKVKIMGLGINAQNCHNQVFASLDFSFEGLYQGIRRSYRFGQQHPVNIYLITTDTMTNVIQSIYTKQKQFEHMQQAMAKAVMKNIKSEVKEIETREVKTVKGNSFELFLGDSVKTIKNIPDESIGFSIFSPPFAELYTYSSELEDMGNSKNYQEFLYAFKFIVQDLYRILWSGRNVAVHCMDLPIQKGKEGYIGLRDFSGMILQAFIDAGFIYHSRVTIWKNPVTEMTRTKALGLLHKQIKKDASMSRVGIPDYLMVFRKPGEHQNPVIHQDTNPNKPGYLPVDMWQKIASPVWMDIDYGNTLNLKGARDEKDEKHICPLQLDTIERSLHLWTNKGDTIYTPFAGIGSELFQALKMERKAIGGELKTSYFDLAVKNCLNAEIGKSQHLLFS